MLKLDVFRCPKCGEFIAIDAGVCRFCSARIDTQTALAAAKAQHSENTVYRTKKYLRHIIIGASLYAVGFLISLGTQIAGVSEQPEYEFLYAGLVMSGIADFIYGLVGYVREQ